MSGSPPKIQVFIPVYNDIKFLPLAINSVLGQKNVSVAIIVSDNASTDGTSEYLTDLAASEPRVSVYRNPQNLGSVPNINRFRELITEKYYMLLCSDDLLGADDSFAAAIEIMDREPNIVSIYCDMLFVDGHGRALAQRKFGRSGVFDAHEALRRSIIMQRNIFGIPLLHRSRAGLAFDYPADLTYTADVYHSAKCGETGDVFHIPRVLIHNRYTGRNLTAGLHRESLKQFEKVAGLFGIQLSPSERAEQRLRAPYTTLSKRIFMRYAAWRTAQNV